MPPVASYSLFPAPGTDLQRKRSKKETTSRSQRSSANIQRTPSQKSIASTSRSAVRSETGQNESSTTENHGTNDRSRARHQTQEDELEILKQQPESFYEQEYLKRSSSHARSRRTAPRPPLETIYSPGLTSQPSPKPTIPERSKLRDSGVMHATTAPLSTSNLEAFDAKRPMVEIITDQHRSTHQYKRTISSSSSFYPSANHSGSNTTKTSPITPVSSNSSPIAGASTSRVKYPSVPKSLSPPVPQASPPRRSNTRTTTTSTWTGTTALPPQRQHSSASTSSSVINPTHHHHQSPRHNTLTSPPQPNPTSSPDGNTTTTTTPFPSLFPTYNPHLPLSRQEYRPQLRPSTLPTNSSNTGVLPHQNQSHPFPPRTSSRSEPDSRSQTLEEWMAAKKMRDTDKELPPPPPQFPGPPGSGPGAEPKRRQEQKEKQRQRNKLTKKVSKRAGAGAGTAVGTGPPLWSSSSSTSLAGSTRKERRREDGGLARAAEGKQGKGEGEGDGKAQEKEVANGVTVALGAITFVVGLGVEVVGGTVGTMRKKKNKNGFAA